MLAATVRRMLTCGPRCALRPSWRDESVAPMIRYHLTTHGHLDGARLSRSMHWTNQPHPSPGAARDAAKADAKGQPFTIETRHFPALSTGFARDRLPE